jgi:DNA-directed RNA polymerase specialized sigma24 family protein
VTLDPLDTRRHVAVESARESRESLRRSRRRYHRALCAAYYAGASYLEIAHALEIRTHHVANTIRNHVNRRCACFDATEPAP